MYSKSCTCVRKQCRVGATLYCKKRALTKIRGAFGSSQKRPINRNPLNRSISQILAHRLLLHVRDGTDSRDRARRHAPGEATWTPTGQKFQLFGKTRRRLIPAAKTPKRPRRKGCRPRRS